MIESKVLVLLDLQSFLKEFYFSSYWSTSILLLYISLVKKPKQSVV